jgi:hypothetical protein
MKIIELKRSEAADLLIALAELLPDDRTYRTVKFSVDSDGLKYKVGEGMWTPSVGHDLNQEVGA